MSRDDSPLLRLKNHYWKLRVAEVGILSLGVMLLVFALLIHFATSALPAVIITFALGLVGFVLRYRQLDLHRLSEQKIASYLNLHFTELQDSADLTAIAPHQLSPLQQLQLKKISAAFDLAMQKVQWPQRWSLSLAVLSVGICAILLLQTGALAKKTDSVRAVSTTTDSLSVNTAIPVPVAISASAILVNPPAYTGLKTVHTKDFNLKVPEGSTVSWELGFSGNPDRVLMIFSDGDSRDLTPRKGAFFLRKTLTQPGFYQLSWEDRGAIKSSEYFKLEVIADQIPKVAISNQEQFVELPWEQEISLQVKASLSDDYGLTDAYVIATVSKGNGESVKFREEKLAFTQPKNIAGKQVSASLELNTQKLGMEPGDELYYYVEAWDNQSPQKQSNRTETHFIQLQDTATQVISFESGLGVDLMPEYFRSQRQIIIDSEKLLAERSSIKKEVFNHRSNELGYDQKVLRLRYGQFMGEEFESGITTETSQPETEEKAPENEADALKQFGHTHDSENEHNLVAAPEHKHTDGEKEESPIEAFAHAHDDAEEATFFVQSVKVKLRAALTLMWDAELHLRMFDPAESLPYQYKILKLLKEISQDSRIYVHRTGFDPPPLKEEKRLSGTLDEVKNSRSNYYRSSGETYPGIRQALPFIAHLLQLEEPVLKESDLPLLTLAGNELAAAAIEQPDIYLERLSILKSIMDGDLSKNNLLLIKQAFWMLLPNLPRAAAGNSRADHPLQDAFIHQLKAQGH